MIISVNLRLKNFGVWFFFAVFAFKIGLSLWQVSPVFIDEIVYADIAAEIGCDNSWKMRCPFMFQPFPTIYSAVLSPSFLFFKSFGMDIIYKAMLLINNLISLLGALAAFGIAKSFMKDNNSVKASCFPWIIAAIVLVWPSLAVYQITLLSENLFIPLYLVSLWLLYIILSRTTRLKFSSFCFGIVLALLYGTRNVNGFLIWPVALLTLAVARQWKAIIFTFAGFAIGFVFVLVPEYLWGAGKLCQYAGREAHMLETLRKVIGNREWSMLFLKRVGNSFLYPVFATFALPIIGSLVGWKQMPKAWRLAWIYVAIGFLLLVPGNVLHTFTETPEKCDLICRYYDPFIMGAVVLSLLSLVSLKISRLFWIIFALCAGLILLFMLQIKFNWWMQTLPLAHLRLLKRNYPEFVYVFAGLLTGGTAIAAWFVNNQKWLKAICVGLLFLCVLDVTNAYHYRQYGVAMKKMNTDAQVFIGDMQQVRINRVAHQLAPGRPGIEILVRLSVYFWTLDKSGFVVK